MKHPNIQWHSAFVEAIQLELEPYRNSLEFHTEYQLTTGPQKIDCLIIKKVRDEIIRKNIASIFREVNILEYKSPDKSVSVAEFYKVYGYACQYVYLEKVSITSLTISFIVSRCPERLFKHLREVRGYKVEENNPGIY